MKIEKGVMLILNFILNPFEKSIKIIFLDYQWVDKITLRC